MSTTPAGFEPARAEHSSLAGCRLNHSAKVSRDDDDKMLKYSATGNRTPGICVTGRDVTNYTISEWWEQRDGLVVNEYGVNLPRKACFCTRK